LKNLNKALLGGAFAILLSAPAYAHMTVIGGGHDGHHGCHQGAACGHDADGDRVSDWSDRCPGTSPLATVNYMGCEVDSDLDGVADYRDDCEYTPPGVQVDGRGCRMDNDIDGIVNSKDQCSDTRYGDRVGEDGCSRDLNATHWIYPNMVTLNFPSGGHGLSAKDKKQLDAMAQYLKGKLGTRVEIQGHADWQGPAVSNAGLGSRRANSAASYLKSKGVNKNQLVTKSFGEDRPRYYNEYKDGRAKNRRVEIFFVRDLHDTDGPTAREYDSIR
jgi:OOP family OmpA-OmpF porin